MPPHGIIREKRHIREREGESDLRVERASSYNLYFAISRAGVRHGLFMRAPNEKRSDNSRRRTDLTLRASERIRAPGAFTRFRGREKSKGGWLFFRALGGDPGVDDFLIGTLSLELISCGFLMRLCLYIITHQWVFFWRRVIKIITTPIK